MAFWYKCILVLSVIVLSASVANAQPKKGKPMTRAEFKKDSLKIVAPKLYRPQLRAENRYVFYKGQSIVLRGFDGGVLIHQKLRIAGGYYFLIDNLSTYSRVDPLNSYQTRSYRLKYGSLNAEFVVKNTRYFSVTTPFEFGFGKNHLFIYDELGGEVSHNQGAIGISYFGVSGIFKPIRWVGLRAVAGYRKTLFNGMKDFYFDGFTGSIGLYVDLHEITKDVRMYRLKKRYKKNFNGASTAVDIITD